MHAGRTNLQYGGMEVIYTNLVFGIATLNYTSASQIIYL